MEACNTRPDPHSIALRGQGDIDWLVKHHEFVDQQGRCVENVLEGEVHNEAMQIEDPYMQWYRRITHRIITRHGATVDYLVLLQNDLIIKVLLRCFLQLPP